MYGCGMIATENKCQLPFQEITTSGAGTSTYIQSGRKGKQAISERSASHNNFDIWLTTSRN